MMNQSTEELRNEVHGLAKRAHSAMSSEVVFEYRSQIIPLLRELSYRGDSWATESIARIDKVDAEHEARMAKSNRYLMRQIAPA